MYVLATCMWHQENNAIMEHLNLTETVLKVFNAKLCLYNFKSIQEILQISLRVR